MNIPVDLSDLVDACDWVSRGEALGAEAYVSRRDGSIYWQGDGVDMDPPEDAGDESVHVSVPNRSEFDLGRDLALRFTEDHLPDAYGKVDDLFHRSGAYRKFKSLLDAQGQLEKWHAYEDAALEEALTQWCADNGFVATRK